MKGKIYCPECRSYYHPPQWLGTLESIKGEVKLLLWCKKCRKEVEIILTDTGEK